MTGRSGGRRAAKTPGKDSMKPKEEPTKLEKKVFLSFFLINILIMKLCCFSHELNNLLNNHWKRKVRKKSII